MSCYLHGMFRADVCLHGLLSAPLDQRERIGWHIYSCTLLSKASHRDLCCTYDIKVRHMSQLHGVLP